MVLADASGRGSQRSDQHWLSQRANPTVDAVLFCPGSLLYFFKDGPFAWNGALSWWLVVVVFCAWFVIMFFALRSAIHQPSARRRAGAGAAGPLLR